ncbi:YqgE/AlgH family protein [Rhodococcus sp. NPDC058505]|uniref:YqgE/AlgH family protein n=1 Tax=unclassified Rhodococcus (in: high G+C Gram-positive bacteria) TaxID=192944 RepID=UPI0036620710
MEPADDPDDRTAPTEPVVRPGSLLVSATALTEPTFRRTVVYMIEHNDAGSLGVVLNRPSDAAVHTVLPQWAQLCARPKALHVGGPVKLDSALCLATLRTGVNIDGVPGLRRVHGRVVMVDLDSDPDQVGPHIEGVRVFAGYAGWTMGQLDGELQRDDWMVVSALPSDVIGPPRVDLWAQVLRRQPLPVSLLATHPIEIDRN